jgi:hypothetical protein
MKKVSSYQKLKQQMKTLERQVNCTHLYSYNMDEWGHITCYRCGHDAKYTEDCCRMLDEYLSGRDGEY